MKFSRRVLGSSTTQDCPGTRVIVPVHVAFRASIGRQHPDCIFSELNVPAHLSPVYASPCSSRNTAQNSGPSGSLILSRKALSSSASCRFIPAHILGDVSRHSCLGRMGIDRLETQSPEEAVAGNRLLLGWLHLRFAVSFVFVW